MRRAEITRASAFPALALGLALAAAGCRGLDDDPPPPSQEELRHRARAEISADQLDEELLRIEREIQADGG